MPLRVAKLQAIGHSHSLEYDGTNFVPQRLPRGQLAMQRQQWRGWTGNVASRWRFVPRFALVTVSGLLTLLPSGQPRAYEIGPTRTEELFGPVLAWESRPGFRLDNLSGAMRNLAAAAERENQPKADSSTGDSYPREPESPLPLGFVTADSLTISSANLKLSRYTGFTQSETSAAWCGSNMLVAFNDTAAEISTIAAASGVSAIGFSVSSNLGSKFTYTGAPKTAPNLSQILAGDPALVCADSKTFYYSAIWMDGVATTNGVAISKSVDGGMTFSAPVPAVTKLNSSHIISRDWLAIDSANPGHLYIAYVDFDFSSTVCGRDPISNQPIARYAVEMVNSVDGGADWSSPTVVEQVCADSTSPNARVMAPQAAVDAEGAVYVVWEAMGENGGPLTARQIRIARSIDGGGSFSAPLQIAAVTSIGNGADLQGFIRGFESPSLTIGKGKKDKGFIYVAWSDASASAADKLSTTGLYGFSDIRFASSADHGATWSTPVRVNNNVESATAQSDQFEPAVGADKNGEIVVCFYDRRRDSNNFLLDRYCGLSTNRGVSWSNRRISSSNFPPLVGQDALVAADYMGEYDVVTGDGLGQHAGLIAPYANNATGHPVVTFKKF